MDLIPNKYSLGSVEIEEISKNQYRGVITHLESGCRQIIEYSNVDGPGKNHLSIPLSRDCSADYGYDMKLTKVFEDYDTLRYGIHLERKD